jgi:flagellar assembly protein FliH
MRWPAPHGTSVSSARTPGRDALRRALDMTANHGPATARLNPDDIDSVGDLAVLAPGRVITIVPDASIEPGGCILEAGSSRVVAQLGTALGRAKRALLS